MPRNRRLVLISAGAIVINSVFTSECKCHEGVTEDKQERRSFKEDQATAKQPGKQFITYLTYYLLLIKLITRLSQIYQQ